jgi:uncharacterized protein
MAETILSALQVYTARPTLRLDGDEIEGIGALIQAMEMRERQGGLSSLELRFLNLKETGSGGTLAFADTKIDFGKELTVYAGDEFGPAEIFRGPVTAVEFEFSEERTPEFVVLAEDALQKARMKRITKHYDDLALQKLVSNIGTDTGTSGNAGELGDSIGSQTQFNETMAGFLRRLSDRYGADVQVVGRDLQGGPLKTVRRNEIELEMHQQLRSVRVVADLSHQATEVTVSGWNAKQGQAVAKKSSGANFGPGTGRKGSDIYQQAFGKRSEHMGQLAVATADEAQTLADAAFDQRARGFVTLHATAEGNPRIRVGTHCKITGMDPLFDNTYYVISANHRWDLVAGYETEFVAECAFLGGN